MSEIDDRDRETILAEDEEVFEIWLVWENNARGLVSLRAVCDNLKKANLYRKTILEYHPESIKVWIEPSLGNHLYAHRVHLITAPGLKKEELKIKVHGKNIKKPRKL